MSKLALFFVRLFCSIVFMFMVTIAVGQVVPPNPDGDVDEDVPITGIEILIGMGGLLGIKKIHDLRKKH